MGTSRETLWMRAGAVSYVLWQTLVTVGIRLSSEFATVIGATENEFEATLTLVLWLLTTLGLLAGSRVCAVILASDPAATSISAFDRSGTVWLLVACIPFTVVLFLALRATLVHQAARAQRRSRRSHIVHRFTAIAATILVLGIGVGAYLSATAPPLGVVPGRQLPAKLRAAFTHVAAPPGDEEILLFYSPAILDAEDEMYVLTDRRIVFYGKSWRTPLLSVAFDEIADVHYSPPSSALEAGAVYLDLVDGSELMIPLPSESLGASLFVREIEERRIERKREA